MSGRFGPEKQLTRLWRSFARRRQAHANSLGARLIETCCPQASLARWHASCITDHMIKQSGLAAKRAAIGCHPPPDPALRETARPGTLRSCRAELRCQLCGCHHMDTFVSSDGFHPCVSLEATQAGSDICFTCKNITFSRDRPRFSSLARC